MSNNKNKLCGFVLTLLPWLCIIGDRATFANRRLTSQSGIQLRLGIGPSINSHLKLRTHSRGNSVVCIRIRMVNILNQHNFNNVVSFWPSKGHLASSLMIGMMVLMVVVVVVVVVMMRLSANTSWHSTVLLL